MEKKTMNIKGLKLDWKKNTATVTNSFMAKASEYGTDEYTALLNVRADGFRINVPTPKKRKACPTRVTFKQMEQLLSCMTDPDERLAELHAIMDVAKAQKNRYEYVRQWFLLNYPNFRDNNPKMDDQHRIIAPKLHILPEAKDEKFA